VMRTKSGANTATLTFATNAVSFSEISVADHLVDHCQVADAWRVTDVTTKRTASLSQSVSLTAESTKFTVLVAVVVTLHVRHQMRSALKLATKAASVQKDS
jgi:hypothetical protein